MGFEEGNATNETIGVHRIEDFEVNETYGGTEFAEFEGWMADIIGVQLAGSATLTGPLLLLMFGAALYKADVSMDTSAAVMIPAVFFLSNEGFMPHGEGIIFAGLMAVTGIFVFGMLKYVAR